MTRVSLKEAYDNKDVVAQIYAIRDIAEGAEDTANGAASTANTASEHVDALVPQVEGAVQNANNASASAQASATTVATYDTRLSEAESKNSQQDSAISALQTADEQNVKINKINQYAVGLTGNQDNITGIKTFVSGILNITTGNPEIRFYDDRNKTNLIAGVGVRFKTATSTNASIRSYAPKINPADNNEIQRGGFLQLVSNQDGTMTLNIFATKADGGLASKVIASFDGTTWS